MLTRLIMDKKITQIINDAIPLNPTCAIERSKEIARRAKLRIEIEALLRDRSQPYMPQMEYKSMRDEQKTAT